MVALAYDNLGAISGVTENPKAPSSMRSRDRNNIQRFAFACDPDRPFTGTIHVQASVGDPTQAAVDILWFDIAEMIIDNEAGTWSYEAEGEFSSVRVVCRTGNYWNAAHGLAAAISGAGGDFTVNGISIIIPAGADATVAAAAVNSDALIITDGTIFADVVHTNQLRIYKNDGAKLTFVDTTNTPLVDLGIPTGLVTPGVITTIRSLR